MIGRHGGGLLFHAFNLAGHVPLNPLLRGITGLLISVTCAGSCPRATAIQAEPSINPKRMILRRVIDGGFGNPLRNAARSRRGCANAGADGQ